MVVVAVVVLIVGLFVVGLVGLVVDVIIEPSFKTWPISGHY